MLMPTTFFDLPKGVGSRLLWCLALATAVFSASALAAPKNWWVNITNDRASEVKAMISRGIDVNSVNADGEPAIMQAIRQGAWGVYDILAADRRTNVNAENHLGETPLMYLAVVGETARAQALIKRGAQVNRLGWAPLHYAASRGHLDTVKMLLANGAQVNAPGPDGTSALMMAAFSGEQPIVQTLLNAGADPAMQTLQKQSAADWARKRGFNELGRKLDAVEQRVLDYRDALRKQSNQVVTYGITAPWGSSQPTNTTQQTDIAPPNLQLDAAQPAAGESSPSSSAVPVVEQKQGASRYFDLKRFDEKVDP
jgi:hypothetical protein